MKNVIQVNENLNLYYEDGYLFRIEKPLDKTSIEIFVNGDKYYYKDIQLHRDNDRPAVELACGIKRWYQNGKCHRENGPAVVYKNGKKVWYTDGKYVRYAD